MINEQQLAILTKPFEDKLLGVKIQSFSKDRTKATLVLYLQHTDVAARLDKATPNWEFKVLNEWQFFYSENKNDFTYYVKAALTLDGITRENVGEGNDPKGAYSDALKRCAMLFGIGRELYDSEVLWIPYNENTDKYKKWTIEEYRKQLAYIHRNDLPEEIIPECTACGSMMLVSKDGAHYFCKNWQDKTVKHPTIPRIKS